MSQIVADAEMVRQLAEATGPVQIVNAEGKMLAVCLPANLPKAAPFTAEYIEQRRKALEPIREHLNSRGIRMYKVGEKLKVRLWHQKKKPKETSALVQKTGEAKMTVLVDKDPWGEKDEPRVLHKITDTIWLEHIGARAPKGTQTYLPHVYEVIG